MLRPQYTRRPFELMLIGPPLSGKRTLSRQFLKCRDVFFSISNVAENVPKRQIPRVDYILIMVDMTNRECLNVLAMALSQIKSTYLTHKLAVVVTKADIPNRWSIEKSEIEQMIAPYTDLQLFYINLTNATEKKAIADQITRLIKINTLQYQNLDIDYIKSQEFYAEDPEQE
ncbi:hypothetical protein MFLAVUS_005624 [Mucor flavus]|uniref:Centromere protein M n=1 Tax=Mucor flavus TaxID=439312 RepID=A0ABP9YZ84_9FUNG